MTKRTRAATAAALSLDTPADALDRRAMLASAGAAAVLAAIGTPSAAERLNPDAPLLGLRTMWLETNALFHVAMDEHDDTLKKAYAFPGWRSADRSTRAALLIEAGAGKTGAQQDEASDANTVVVDEIAAIPARTLAGLAFKVEVSRDWEHDRESLTASIMTDVAAFAAAHPTLRI